MQRKAKQMINLLLLNNFYPAISHRRIILYGSVTRPSFSLSFHDGAHSVAIEKENIDGLCACCASTSWPWEGWVNIPRFATTLTEVSVPSWEKFRCLVWKLVSSSSSMRDAWTSRLATRMFSTVISYVSLGFWIECYKEYCCNFVFFIGILNWML